ncbi:chlorophyllase/cutinase-like alpha/beta fold protein [Candidatus Paracaedibacter symbiosus]|uniref:alpha/beta hydrolase n=1 Tax=Candidatus Paracaedibacter symbiosus TaxID=244582 RepID=UPI000509BCCA|nr:acetylxylan esterase [Candidatus Paracaedibacter symbiosus]
MIYHFLFFLCLIIETTCALEHNQGGLIFLEDTSRSEINMAALWPEEVIKIQGTRQLQIQILNPKTQGKFPIILFSGGWSVNFRHYSQILNSLVAKGYIIVNIDHYYQKDTASHSLEFDAAVAELKTALQNQDAQTKEERFTRTKLRALDVYYHDIIFVLQQLKEILHALPEADLSRIALMGHSLGGNANKKLVENLATLPIPLEIQTAIKACVSLDSRLNQLNLKTTFEKPSLLLGANEEYKKTDPLRELPPQSNLQLILLEHASHVSFLDTVIFPLLGKDTKQLIAGLNSSATKETEKFLAKVKTDPKAYFNGTREELTDFLYQTVDYINQFLKKQLLTA